MAAVPSIHPTAPPPVLGDLWALSGHTAAQDRGFISPPLLQLLGLSSDGWKVRGSRVPGVLPYRVGHASPSPFRRPTMQTWW